MTYAVPFALDGAGTFYLFDLRKPTANDQFAVVVYHAGSLVWDEDDYESLAESFAHPLDNVNL